MRKGELAINLYLPGIVVVGVIVSLLAGSSGKFVVPAVGLIIIGFVLFAKAKWSRIRDGALTSFGPAGMTTANRRLYFTGYATMVVGLLVACI